MNMIFEEKSRTKFENFNKIEHGNQITVDGSRGKKAAPVCIPVKNHLLLLTQSHLQIVWLASPSSWNRARSRVPP